MLQCWNKNPSERPSFSSLKERLENFSSYSKLPLQFPKKADKDHPYASGKLTKAAKKQHQPEDEDPFNSHHKRHSFHNGNDYHLAGTLTVQDVRRVLSEPALDNGMELFTAPVPSGNSSRERSLTNSYVDLPQRKHVAAKDVAEREKSRHESGEQMMLNLEVPQVQISSASDN